MLIKNFKSNEKIIYQRMMRNYGLDLLKILAMINILNLHINLGAKLLQLNPHSLKFNQVFRLEIFSYWPVDAFGIISGIVGYKKYKFNNIIYLWFIYAFYSIIFSIILYYKSEVSYKNLFLSFFPIGIRRSWFINAYIFMYYFLPFVTNSINYINKNLYNKIVFHFFFIYSIYHTIMKNVTKKPNFNYINEGFSSLWLLILYIVGAYLGKFYIGNNSFSCFIYLQIYLIISFIASEHFIYNAKKYNVQNFIFMSYVSPVIIIQALSLIFFFSNLKINNKYLTKIISFFYPLNFSVTIIHSRFFFSSRDSQKLFKFINSLSHKYLFFKIYGTSVVIYFICTFIDYLRFLLFKLFQIRKLCNFGEKILF